VFVRRDFPPVPTTTTQHPEVADPQAKSFDPSTMTKKSKREAKKAREEAEKGGNDAWSLYMKEVEKYENATCKEYQQGAMVK